MTDATSDTSWLEALTSRGGPFVAAARRFLASHPGAPRAPFPRGVPGLSRLAEAIDAWAERELVDVSIDDDGFVEGAGALLGLLLVDHLPEAGHASRQTAHRVRVGAHGFFDPFRAVESALEGPIARNVLLEEVARAEAEADARAGVGRAMRILCAQLPDNLGVREHFENHVVLDDGVEIDLSRAITASEGEDEQVAALAIEKLLSMLPGSTASAGLSWEEARAFLFPRLVAHDFLARLGTEGARLSVTTLASGALSVALILLYEGRARYLREDELERWGVHRDRALGVAMENLGARSADARFVRVDAPEGPLCLARTGDGLDAARLLLPTLHDVLAPELGSPFLAAVPHRDALWAASAEPPSLRQALARRVSADCARAPHRIGDTLFLIGAKGLRRA